MTLRDFLILRQNYGLSLGAPPPGWGNGDGDIGHAPDGNDGGGNLMLLRAPPGGSGTLLTPWSGGRDSSNVFRTGGAITLVDSDDRDEINRA